MGIFLAFGVGVFLTLAIAFVVFYAKIWNWIFDMLAVFASRRARKQAIKKRERDLKNRT